MHQIAQFKMKFGEACPNPLANAWLGHASQAPAPLKKKNSWPPLANPAYAHELLLRNLFENPPWQTDRLCVVRYMSMHYKIFLEGKKND